MLTDIAAFVFWISAAVIVFTYAAYPLLIWVCSRLRARQEVPFTPAERAAERLAVDLGPQRRAVHC